MVDLGPDPHGTRTSMYEDFCKSLDYTIGKKYIKVLRREGEYHSSVCAFIVNTENDKKFAYGDILKPAGCSHLHVTLHEVMCLILSQWKIV